MTGIHIRRARSSDVQTLTALAFRSKASHGYDQAFMEACREEITIHERTPEERELWVAEAPGGTILGFYGLWPTEEQLSEVDPVYVDPDNQGIGVGRALWAHLEGSAERAGASIIGLDADPHAVGFYEKMGCKVTGEAPSGSIPGRMLPRMEKPLP